MSELLTRLRQIDPNLSATEVVDIISKQSWNGLDFLYYHTDDDRRYLICEPRRERNRYWGPDSFGYYNREGAGTYSPDKVKSILRAISRPENIVVELL